jgi:hypothetical protein
MPPHISWSVQGPVYVNAPEGRIVQMRRERRACQVHFEEILEVKT